MMTPHTQPIESTRTGAARVWSTGLLAPNELIRLAREPGERLSLSPKSEVVRVGEWVVKRSRFQRGAGPIRLTAKRNRYRKAWQAAGYLDACGVGVPLLAGYVEFGVSGVIWQNALITRYLEGCVNIRTHALKIAAEPEGVVTAFLEALASDVQKISAGRAYHSDLADKNIFTKDGTSFVFLDLESVFLDRTMSLDDHVRNHIQLLDAFYDVWPYAMLRPLIAPLVPQGQDPDAWFHTVLQGLENRVRERDAFIRRALIGMDKILGKQQSP